LLRIFTVLMLKAEWFPETSETPLESCLNISYQIIGKCHIGATLKGRFTEAIHVGCDGDIKFSFGTYLLLVFVPALRAGIDSVV